MYYKLASSNSDFLYSKKNKYLNTNSKLIDAIQPAKIIFLLAYFPVTKLPLHRSKNIVISKSFSLNLAQSAFSPHNLKFSHTTYNCVWLSLWEATPKSTVSLLNAIQECAKAVIDKSPLSHRRKGNFC